MNTAAFSPPGAGPSPEALRDYLSERSQQELDALRAELETRLGALENALTSPDECESLESLVLDLARVAKDEAEAATRRAIFDAQAEAQAQADTAGAEARTAIEAARTVSAALHKDLEAARAEGAALHKDLTDARTALESEREAGSALQRELKKLRTTLDAERAASEELRRDVEQAQTNLRAEEETSTALQQSLDEAERRAVAVEEANGKELRRVQEQFAKQLAQERATIAELTDAQARLEPLLAAALNDADARSAEIEAAISRADALEQRWKDAEQERDQASARADNTIRERDAMAVELEAARKASHADADTIARTKQAQQEAQARADAAARDRDALALELEKARKASQSDAESIARTKHAQQEVQRDRDALALELEAARKASRSDAEALAAAKKAAKEAEGRVEAAVREWDALVIELDAARQSNKTESEAVALATQARHDAEARVEAAMLERDALARELETAHQAGRNSNAEATARAQALEAEHTKLMQEWQDDVVRLEVATRERDALAIELEAVREAAIEAQAQDRARQQEFYDAAEQRIRELEMQLLQPDIESMEGETIGVSLLDESPQAAPPPVTVAPAHQGPPRRASRHAFHQDVQIQIDGSATQLVDLSTTGAQVISPTALKPNRMVKVLLPFDESAVSCRGKIVWARLEPPTAGGSFCYRAGVLFTSVDEKAVETFIAHHGPVSR